jgi:tRNA(Ile)-lysidine synthase
LNGGAAPLAAISKFIQGLPTKARVMVALSGGGDSLGLLVALIATACRQGRNLEICAATVDHRLRSESGDEAKAMEKFCVDRGVPHRTLVWGSEKPQSGISEAARRVRYGLLLEAARAFGADMVVTGHTRDDQLETVAMRQSRRDEGRGLAGMAEMTLFEGWCWVARPFLDVERRAIRDFLKNEGVGWFDDPSNDNPKYERVRMRLSGQYPVGDEDIRAFATERRQEADRAAD